MQISSTTCCSNSEVQAVNRLDKVKQFFDQIGAALDAGKLSDAKKVLEELQKKIAASANGKNSPRSAKIDTLSKALDSGDLQAAKAAFADLKQRPSTAVPPQVITPSGGVEEPSISDSLATIYDAKNLSHDVKVSEPKSGLILNAWA